LGGADPRGVQVDIPCLSRGEIYGYGGDSDGDVRELWGELMGE